MVVPAYNEEEILESFVRKSMRDMARVSDDFEIVLVNDGSTDNTSEIAQKLAAEFPNLRLVDLERNLGTGKSILPGFAAASKEIVFNNTVDAFFDTEDIPVMLPYLDTYDVVSGYRSDLSANSLYQKVLTIGNYVLIRLLFCLRLKAYQTVQFHRKSFLDSISIEAESSFISPELLLKAHRAGKSIKEVKIKYHARLAGKAKGGNIKNVLRSLKDVLRLWFRWAILKRMQCAGKS